MQKEPAELFTRRLVSPLLTLELLCLFIFGFHAYLGLGQSVSVCHFDLSPGNDTRWGYDRQTVASFSPSGARLRTGDSFCIGPFRVTQWRDWRDWKVN